MHNSKFIKISRVVCEAVYEVWQLIGKKQSDELDLIATRKYDDLLTIFPKINVIGIEGERDGIYVSELQKIKNSNDCEVQLAIDPIDGTKTCGLGGSRAVSVLAVDSRVTKVYKKIPDTLSFFSVASNIDREFTNVIYEFAQDKQFVRQKIRSVNNISSLRRDESEQLWDYISGELQTYHVGETTCYLPNRLGNNIFEAGDSSVTLFLESEHFIGRSGASEAILEARLWKYWKGLLVSGRRLKRDPEGAISHLCRRINAAVNQECIELCDFFEEAEIEELEKNGWKKSEILGLLDPNQVAPDFNLIIIASISGTIDCVLKTHSRFNLSRPRFDKETNRFIVPAWIKYDEFIGFGEFYYDPIDRSVAWKKKTM